MFSAASARHTGHYTLVARKFNASGREVYARRVADFSNIIVDTGLNGLALASNLITSSTSNAYGGTFAYCKVGAGATPPTSSDTALTAFIAATNAAATTQASSSVTRGVVANSPTDTYNWVRIVWRFATGTAAGNLTEVAMAAGSGATGNLFSRALILDANGQPTTVVILADEVLDVVYELRSYRDFVETSVPFVLNGENYVATIKPGDYNTFRADNSLNSSLTAQPYSTFTMPTTATQTTSPGTTISGTIFTNAATYVQGSYKLTYRFTAGLNSFNSPAGVKGMRLYQSLGLVYYIMFDKPIMKTADDVFSFSFDIGPWGRKA